MAPSQQAAPLHLPPSSPNYGVIRLMQHDRHDKPIRLQQDPERSDAGLRQTPKGQSPASQHSSLKERKSVEEEREGHSVRYAAHDRSGSMRRELSNPSRARDGGVSVIHRSDMMTDPMEEHPGHDMTQSYAAQQQRPPPSHHHHGGHHHHHHLHQHHHLHHQPLQNSSRQSILGRASGSGQMQGPTGFGTSKSVRAGSSREAADQGSRLDVESQSSSTRAGPSHHAGKLFDPRKDDPVRFAALKTKHGLVATSAAAALATPASSSTTAPPSTSTFSTSSFSDSRSNASIPTTNASSSGGREKRRRRGPSSRTTAESSGDGKKAENADVDNNSYVRELKRWYREITRVEQKLQEEHRAASERQRRDQAELKSCSDPLYAHFRSGKPGFTTKGELDHAYWIDVVSRHRYLAETHAAFMEAALKPGLPTSLHSLPQNYSIPTRLWHTGFHSLLERLRHALPSLTPTTVDSVPAKEIEGSRLLQHQVLDLIIEFIYFAYSFYTNLLESETFKSFRNSWIENLGDLARYRMAVAKIMASPGVDKEAPRAKRDDAQGVKTFSEEESGLSTPHAERDIDSEEILHEKGSIGVGALEGWDLEEKEVWRDTAKEWYALGLAEMPGTGRLHHHLGILSRDDELRSLHHFCKSLTCSHPYASGRESLLPLFERDVQQQRLRSDATLVDLFLYLHGLLFTKVQLDDFDTILSRFEETLRSEISNNGKCIVSASAWIMMATISVASLLQYGSNNSASKPQISDTADGENQRDEEESDESKKYNKEPAGELDAEEDRQEDEDEETEGAEDGNKGKQLASMDSSNPGGNTCITMGFAARLAFTILSVHLEALATAERPGKVNPFVTMLLTFLSQECKETAYLKLIERYVPWLLLVQLGGSIPSCGNCVDPRRDTATRIRADSGPLAEDWSLRGMAWVGRRVFERGFWKARSKGSPAVQHFESEVEMLNQFGASGAGEDESASSSSSGESTGEQNRDKTDDAAVSLSTLRWRRVAHTLTILAKIIPGLDFHSEAGADSKGKLVVTSPLKDKIAGWQLEDELKLQDILMGRLGIHAKGQETSGDRIIAIKENDEGDEIHEADNEEIRHLKQRRKELRKELLESRPSPTDVPSGSNCKGASISAAPGGKKGLPNSSDKDKKMHVAMLPSYTILILDTNVLLTPTSILERLIQSEKWCAVVPLVVITELQGLTKRSGMIGQRAERCIEYLEKEVKAKSHYVKIQTSRGNYLNDLQFRTEDIDFSGARPAQSSTLPSAPLPSSSAKSRGLEDRDEPLDPGHHRTARSIDEVILFCLEWQNNHFLDRSAFLCKDRDEFQRTQSNITDETCKAVLITLDKNLRLKAKSRHLVAASPDELADLMTESVE